MPLKPWRTVAAPHPDVQAGRYRKDEYMADLGAVVSGEAEEQYRVPVEFYRRTFVTAGMRELLSSVLSRLVGGDGDPVVQLKTSFGGGKTHSMLALYHLVREPQKIAREGLWPEGLRVTAERVPAVRLAALPCPSLDATKPRPHPALGGRPVRTLWGEIAVQLLGADGYALVHEADERGMAPGGNTMAEVLRAAGPCLILMDEFVAYVRNMYRLQVPPPGGSFDSNLTFLQVLTEAVKRVPGSTLVASLPASKVELGGEGGEAALERVEQIFGRVEAVWRPVGVEESFEVVRRRLFSEVTDVGARDASCQAFFRLYQRNRAAFPIEASEPPYLGRLHNAYPIHPEVFDRLYSDWSTLDGFQRTRGVLRLMAAVVHALWAENDPFPLILPGSLPLREDGVRSELTKPLPQTENWNTVLETDVDGPRSAAYALDTQYQRFGKLLAARRLARSIFLQTAPGSVDAGQGAGRVVRGVEEARLRLGVLQPEEQPGLFHDALEQMQQNFTTYLHRSTGQSGQAGDRYWFDLRQSLGRLMESRARDRLRDGDEPERDVPRRLRDQVKDALKNGGQRVFTAAHVVENPDAKEASTSVPDEDGARLVILGLAHGYRDGGDSAADTAARIILVQRGEKSRSRQNLLVFLAPQKTEVENLRLQAARYLAWVSIEQDAKQLNLDAYQTDEAERSRDTQDKAVSKALDGAYRTLLVPIQPVEEGQLAALHLVAVQFTASGGNVVRDAFRRAEVDEIARRVFAPELLLPELERWFWRETLHTELSHLWGCFIQYSYLPRLRDPGVLRDSVRAGVQAGLFAFAEGQSTLPGQYTGVVVRATPTLAEGTWHGLLVRPDAVQPPTPLTEPPRAAPALPGADEPRPGGWGKTPLPEAQTLPAPQPAAMEVVVTAQWQGDAVRRLTDLVSRTQVEVLAELLSALGMTATAELKVTVTAPAGIGTDNIRVAVENARALEVKIEVH